LTREAYDQQWLNLYRFSELLSETSSGILLPPPNANSPFDLEKQRKIVYTMATCHSLRVVDGELLGDPLDVKMFQFSGWSYEEGGGHASEQTSPKFDTIIPSVAKPPVTHGGDSQPNGPNVSFILLKPQRDFR
jgi:cation-transporting ATPase 13A3/4/5